MTGTAQLSIIIPAYNEEQHIANTLYSLAQQFDSEGLPLQKHLYQLIVVDNDSSDRTVDIIADFKRANRDVNCFVITETVKSPVAARIAGYDFVLGNDAICTDILASGDADVIFHPNWIYSSLNKFNAEKIDVLSCAGCFPREFWAKVPNLTQRYLDEVGTIFFDQETIDWLGCRGRAYLFTEQIFIDFIRLATDQCFALTREIYERVGGYTRCFSDTQRKKEVFDEGGRLLAKIERTTANIAYSSVTPYKASPRKLLNEPVTFLKGKSYRRGEMFNYRVVGDDRYDTLNDLARQIDYDWVRRYIVQNYIILKCITRPFLILKHQRYFGALAEDLLGDIQRWWANNSISSGNEVIELSEVLTNKYYSKILSCLPIQVVH